MSENRKSLGARDFFHFTARMAEEIAGLSPLCRWEMQIVAVVLVVWVRVIRSVDDVADDFAVGIETGAMGGEKALHGRTWYVVQPVDGQNGVNVAWEKCGAYAVVLTYAYVYAGLSCQHMAEPYGFW